MDPLAHTLFGATMAEAVLKRNTALATATLIIGANIPDIDAITMLVSSDHALWFRIKWLRPDSIELIGVPIPIEETDPNVEAALNSPDIRGFRNWMCFPVYEVRRLDDGWTVIVRDLRYVHPEQEFAVGVGIVVVELDDDLQLRHVR